MLRILLAEDNPVNQQLERRLLERRGHHVTIAESRAGRRWSAWNASSFDVILMDVQMPDMDGLEATAAIRAEGARDRSPHSDHCADRANDDRKTATGALAAGMDAFITKPIDAVEFLQVVEAVAAGVEDPAATGS